MEAEGGVSGAQVSHTSPTEGGGEGAGAQNARKRRWYWTAEEDAVLAAHVLAYGVGKWDAVPKLTGLARTGQSCRFRWLNNLRPDLKNGVVFSRDEELQLCLLHAALGNKWSHIAAKMEGRSENEVMRYWFSYVNRCRKAGLDVYPPEVRPAAGQPALHQPQEVQPAAGQPPLHQPQRKRHKSRTSLLPQQPPSPVYPLPVGNPDYAVVPTHPSQPLGAVYPLRMATAPPPFPVMAEEALSGSEFWVSLLSFSTQNVETQWMQPQLPVLPLGNTMDSNEKDQLLPLLLLLSTQNVEQGRQPQPSALPLGNATKFNEESQPSSSLLPQSNQNVEQVRQPQQQALPTLEDATECNQEGQLLTSLPSQSNQNAEQERQSKSPTVPYAMEANEEEQPLTSLLPQPNHNVERESQPQSPAVPLRTAMEPNEGDQLLTSLPPQPNQNLKQESQTQSPPLPPENAMEFNEEDPFSTSFLLPSDQNLEQEMQPQAQALPFGYAMEFNDEFEAFTEDLVWA